jgi:hypothetical protein
MKPSGGSRKTLEGFFILAAINYLYVVISNGHKAGEIF